MARRHKARGAALLELMISAVILLIVVTGFVGAVKEAMSATAVAHRRTEATLLRTGLLEKLAVAPRAAIVALQDEAWRVESCYDQGRTLQVNAAGATAIDTSLKRFGGVLIFGTDIVITSDTGLTRKAAAAPTGTVQTRVRDRFTPTAPKSWEQRPDNVWPF